VQPGNPDRPTLLRNGRREFEELRRSHILDFAYRVFAKIRLRLTGRCEKQACAVLSD